MLSTNSASRKNGAATEVTAPFWNVEKALPDRLR